MSRGLMPIVQITILVRDMENKLSMFLKCVENIDYDPEYLSIYVHTNNNSDNTNVKLRDWCKKIDESGKYRSVTFLEEYFHELDGVSAGPGGEEAWYAEGGIRLSTLGKIRNASMYHALNTGCDYYFVCDGDNFFPPETIKYCVRENKPIFAPMMVQNNGAIPRGFYLRCSSNGYYDGSEENKNMSRPIWNKTLVGTFAVDLVHMCYMIRTDEIHKGLDYTTDGVQMEYVTFSASARKNGVQQYVGNEVQTLIDPTDDYDMNVNICRNLCYHL